MITPDTTKAVLLISGMRDNACRQKIAEALESVAGVNDVDVNLYRACANIVYEPPCDSAELVRAINRAGYAAELTMKEQQEQEHKSSCAAHEPGHANHAEI